MDQITLQIRRVQAFVASSVVTKTKLALTAGLPITTLIGMESLDWNPRSSTLRALVRAIDKLESDAAKKKARDELRRQQEAAPDTEHDGIKGTQPGFTITQSMRERAAEGLPLFRAGQQEGTTPAGRMTVEAARKVIDPIIAKWTNAPRVVVVAAPSDLPMQAPDDARGVYHQGTVYIVASGHNSGHSGGLMRTLAHEAVAHYGLRGLLGGDGYQRFLNQMQVSMRMGNKALIEIRDDVRSRYGQLSALKEADEIAARAVELGVDQKTGEFKTGFGWLKAMFAKVAQALMAVGIECFRVQFPKGMDANEYACKVQPADKALALLDHEQASGMITTNEDYVSAAKFYASIAQSDAKPEVALKGAALLQQGLDKAAVTASMENYKLMGDCYMIGQKEDQALAAYSKASPLAANGDIDYLRAQILGSQTEWAQARDVLQKGIARGVTQKGKAYLLLGKLDLGNKDKAAAKAAFQKAAQEADTHDEAQAQLAKLGGK